MSFIIITIPAHNEEKTIGALIRDIREVMKKIKEQYKIIVCDDGSTDKTKEIAKKEGALIFTNHIRVGLAETYRREMKYSLELNPDIIVHIDADYQYSPKDIPRLIEPIKKKEADLVLGNRFMGGIEKMPWLKKLGNRAFSFTISRIIKYKIGDCQTGFRAMTREVAALPIISNHTYTQEAIIRAVRSGFKIIEIPTYFYERKIEQSKLLKNPIEYACKAWINIFRLYRDFEPLKFFGRIGLGFILIGLAIGTYVISDFIVRKNVGHLPFAIMTGLLIVIGIQIILFGFLADMNKA